MPYETIVLTDGMAVLFAVLDEPQETWAIRGGDPSERPYGSRGCHHRREPRDRLRAGVETARGYVTAGGKTGQERQRTRRG